MHYREDTYREEWLDEEPAIITIREVVYNPLEAPTMGDTAMFQKRRWRFGGPLVLLIVIGLLFAVAGGVATAAYNLLPEKEVYVIVENTSIVESNHGLSPIFTPQVHYWSKEILEWAAIYKLEPNLIATVMQIESCGDPNAGSSAGAQGLFQVMPFHFSQGEVMRDVQTNAKRGLNYLAQGLLKAEGDAGLAMAGYNGGHGVIDWGWGRWPDETRRYFYWATGIYEEALSGTTNSSRLAEWLSAGGSYLCNQAAQWQASTPRS